MLERQDCSVVMSGFMRLGSVMDGCKTNFKLGERNLPHELGTWMGAKDNVVVVFGVVTHWAKVMVLVVPLQEFCTTSKVS